MMTLQQYRNHVGLSQKEIGQRLGVTAVTYGQWETGKRTPSGTTLMRIAQAFGATVHILPGEGIFFLPAGEWQPPPPPDYDDPALGQTID